MLVLMRCVLAFTALAILWLEVVEPGEVPNLACGTLALDCFHGAVVALVSYQSGWPAPARALHRIDVVFFAGLGIPGRDRGRARRPNLTWEVRPPCYARS